LGTNLLILGCLGSYLKRANVMLVFLQMSMDPLKLYGFLFRASGPGKPMNVSNRVTTTSQREDFEDEKWNRPCTKCLPLLLKRNVFVPIM
jgi:hypothetical protein